MEWSNCWRLSFDGWIDGLIDEWNGQTVGDSLSMDGLMD